VACFLPGRAKDLSAPCTKTFQNAVDDLPHVHANFQNVNFHIRAVHRDIYFLFTNECTIDIIIDYFNKVKL